MMWEMSNSSSHAGSSNRVTGSCSSKVFDRLVRQTLDEICSTLATGETVKLSSLGIFSVRDKAHRIGRNPKTGDVVPVEARQSITFSSLPILKARINGSQQKPRPG